ncbi:MAG: ABC transporter ATP-binding protein [Actinomycetota bacterium]
MTPNGASRDSFISISGLNVTYDGRTPAVEDLEMMVEQGDFVAVLGPSGCGKSTLLHVMAGLLDPVAGRIEIGGRQIRGGDEAAPAVGYVFQDHRLLPWRTVEQNIRLVLQSAHVPKAEQDERIDEYLRMLRIEEFRTAWPMKLSGGQRQRVSIARALALQPGVVLMDEPFSTLDEVTARLMRQQLAELWDRHRQTIVFVTHSIREAVFLSNRIFILTSGPARVFDIVDVPISRPRRYEDPSLTELEGRIVERVMGVWGYEETGERG